MYWSMHPIPKAVISKIEMIDLIETLPLLRKPREKWPTKENKRSSIQRGKYNMTIDFNYNLTIDLEFKNMNEI